MRSNDFPPSFTMLFCSVLLSVASIFVLNFLLNRFPPHRYVAPDVELRLKGCADASCQLSGSVYSPRFTNTMTLTTRAGEQIEFNVEDISEMVINNL